MAHMISLGTLIPQQLIWLVGHGGSGELPYIGITKETCSISDDVIGQDILLVDDLYTKTVNIDEDCIQALLDKGARSVTFYSIGKTLSRY